MNSTDNEVDTNLLDDILAMHKPLHEFDDEETSARSSQIKQILKAASFVFHSDKSSDLLNASLNILDMAAATSSKHGVNSTLRVLKCESSHRRCFVVQGSNQGVEYVCFREFCSCRNFYDRVRMCGKNSMVSLREHNNISFCASC